MGVNKKSSSSSNNINEDNAADVLDKEFDVDMAWGIISLSLASTSLLGSLIIVVLTTTLSWVKL